MMRLSIGGWSMDDAVSAAAAAAVGAVDAALVAE